MFKKLKKTWTGLAALLGYSVFLRQHQEVYADVVPEIRKKHKVSSTSGFKSCILLSY